MLERTEVDLAGVGLARLDLAIVILNYNVRDLLRACLRSIERSATRLRLEVWVVDNGSDDDSIALVRQEFPGVNLRASENGGFARGNNLALREILARASGHGLPRYVLLLNPDTELPPRPLDAMVTLLDEPPELGAARPKV